jgi:hypothetical protein
MTEIIPTKIEHKPLHCPICGTRFMNVFGQPLPMHAQVRCITSVNNEMDLGICSDCVEKGVSIDMCNAVLEGIKDFWIAEIEANTQMTEEEKQKRIDFHNSHSITEVRTIILTGKEAEADARSKGKLQ